ncbi:glycosyltransferase family 2 protein [Crenobacter cavernae]|uniref:Glycosyltransferase family 2 protein n=1 Tax=Crenobacter cavernae TaxID=2290923 RepID=A0A345Y531_9NEIS|nr:glycosyltransferase family 2 protein [Crenobacter cavernae]AXK39033.1 glycosyltransferase family 2 protein [Crenobacter cavernae]
MIYTILVNWNGGEETIASLSSLMKLNVDKFHVLVCDNNSTDESLEKLNNWVTEHKLTCVSILQTGHNLGFAGGNNVGIKVALKDPETTHIWLLNNDTLVDEKALTAMLQVMEKDPQIGICGSTLLYEHDPKAIQAVGGYYNSWLGISSHALGGEPYSAELCKSVDPGKFDYIVGASMLVSREFIEKVGLMDEQYFLYCEELDWATRAKRAGFKLGYAPQSIVYHKEGATTGSAAHIRRKARSEFADRCALRSHLIYARKFHPVRKWTVWLFYIVKSIKRLMQGDIRGSARVLACFFNVKHFISI